MPVMTSEMGNSSSPMPRYNRGWATYMRAAAVSTWPHERRWASRSGAAGRHVALRSAQTIATSTASTASTVGSGLSTARQSRREPAAIAPQKKSVVRVPSTPPTGTA